ncbi:hypothetical protein JCM6882_006766 [Rhodosporidiobolus microsporus]
MHASTSRPLRKSLHTHGVSASFTDNHFRIQLIMRDQGDRFSDRRGDMCIPAHLVPQSRDDVYKSLLDVEYLFDPSYGLLMDRILHHQYDKYQWSLYAFNSRYYFHAFDARPTTELKRHHGQSFADTDCKYAAPPSTTLCTWHYQQCVLMYLRGYSVGMAINAQ